MNRRPDRHSLPKETMQNNGFDAETIAKKIAEQTDEVLDYVNALESAPGPSDETLRTRICV